MARSGAGRVAEQHRKNAVASPLNSSGARIEVARAALFPSLSLTGDGGYLTNDNLLSSPNAFWAIGPSFALSAGAGRLLDSREI
jgi:outer membrane protein TolC